jgi:2-polyprenyl-6-methoxyphenol hydroxylase-like FAD-dependent oxidoreductase
MAKTPVLIVGAGPTGLVLGIWLTRLGVPVRIVDRAAGPGTTSRALAVQARTLEFYRQAGFADAVIEGGVKIANLNFWVEGARKASLSLRGIGEGLSPYSFALGYPQDAHETLLVAKLEEMGIEVERETELVDAAHDERGVRATLRRPDGSTEEIDAGYLTGCDGASSTVREKLGVGFPGGTYQGLFYVADIDAAGPAVDGELHIDIEDADFMLVFPLKDPGHLRLVGPVHERSGREKEDLTFDDVRGRVVDDLKLEIRRVAWFSTYRVHHRVADRFSAGRVFLLGDAAHIHSPVGGQGMNTGIGDAVNLAWKLAAVLSGEARDDLLSTYEPERLAFARRLVATTDRVFVIVSRRGGVARLVRKRVVPIVIPRVFRIPAAAASSSARSQIAVVIARRTERRLGRHSRRRPAPVGSRRSGRRQLRSALLDEVAGARLWRTGARHPGSLRGARSRDPPVRLAAGDEGRRARARRSLPRPTRRLRRALRSGRGPEAPARVPRPARYLPGEGEGSPLAPVR